MSWFFTSSLTLSNYYCHHICSGLSQSQSRFLHCRCSFWCVSFCCYHHCCLILYHRQPSVSLFKSQRWPACVKWLPAISTIQIFIYVCLFSLPYSNQIDGLREMACVKWPPAISPIQIFIYVCLFFKNCICTSPYRACPHTHTHVPCRNVIYSLYNLERRAYFRSIFNK